MSAAQGLHGVFPYLVSPIDAAGAVNEAVLAKLCDDLIAQGVHGLTPLGSTGEFAYLSWAQKRRVVEVVVASAKQLASAPVPLQEGVYVAGTNGTANGTSTAPK